MEVTQGHPSVCRNFLFPSFDAMILSNSFNLVNHLWISVMSWKRTGCGRQLGMCCLHGLFVCCGSVGWFSLSRRLRQDCQLPYASYLENICWHPCPCLHLSVIYCMSYTSDLSSYWYVTQMLSCLFFCLLFIWPQTIGFGTWCRMQIRQ